MKQIKEQFNLIKSD